MTHTKDTREAIARAIKFALSAYTSDNSKLMDCDLDDAATDILADLKREGFTISHLTALQSAPAQAGGDVREALNKIDKLTQYSDGNPEGQLFAVQQIIREHRALTATPAQPEGDLRPPRCRQRLKDEGKPRPRSGCYVDDCPAALTATPAQSGWRPGLDGAPLDATPFFVWYVPHKGSITPRPRRMTCRFRKSVLEYRHSHGWFTLLNGEYIIDGITHWMPEPLPPQLEGET